MAPALRALLVACLLLLVSAPGRTATLLDDTAAVDVVAEAIADRLALMPAVAAAKWASGAPVTDAARERAVLDAVAERAQAMGLPADAVRALFEPQIELARAIQEGLHVDWRRQGRCEPCAGTPTLAALRGRLDEVTRAQLRAIHVALPALAQPVPLRAALVRRLAPFREVSPAEVGALVTAFARMRREQPPGLARIRGSGVLRVGTTGDYDPFSSLEDGDLRGTDIDRATRLARALGVEPVFVRTSWPTLLADLAADRFDLAAGGVSVTPERAAAGLFSRAYHVGGKTILARCADRARLDSLKALNRDGVRVIVNPGGTNERFVREHIDTARIRVFPDNRAIFAELVAGRADAMITDDTEADLQARRHPELCRTLPGTLNRQEKALFMVRDPALRDTVDRWLATTP